MTTQPAPGPTADFHHSGSVLARITQAAALGRIAVELVVGPLDAATPLTRVSIVEPGRAPGRLDATLALIIGASGAAACETVTASARAGAVAVAVRCGERGAGRTAL
ncbi:hypothetical protein, partial [Streptomyces beihaiensis]|nr:hypothetical protein [Streptomyces beihaiensis]